MTEGCKGGWALFHGFFAENGGLVSEECAPYTKTALGQKCADYKKCDF
jgi:hypothetical protein